MVQSGGDRESVSTHRGSELVRGRGGPRCMTMPFYREKL